MQSFPHNYTSTTVGHSSGYLTSHSRTCPQLPIAEPSEFGGDGEVWSPEQLFISTVASCLILTFRVIARASNFEWQDIACEASGKLDRVEGMNMFTQVNLDVRLTIDSATDEKKALRILTKAENQCLIKNSMASEVNFKNEIIIN